MVKLNSKVALVVTIHIYSEDMLVNNPDDKQIIQIIGIDFVGRYWKQFCEYLIRYLVKQGVTGVTTENLLNLLM